MGLARDSSSPAIALGAYSGVTPTSQASNSFSPPAGSVIIVTAYGQNGYAGGGWAATPATVTDSLGTHLTWTLFKSEAATAYESGVWAWWAYTATAPGSMTVTSTLNAASGQYVQQMDVSVDVWTGANTTGPIGATDSGTYAGQALAQAVTPTATGSALVMAAADGANTGTQAAGTGCYMLDTDATNLLAGEAWYGTSGGFTATTASTPETLAITGGTASATFEYIAYEVLAAGGPTPVSSSDTGTGTDHAGLAYSGTNAAVETKAVPGFAGIGASSPGQVKVLGGPVSISSSDTGTGTDATGSVPVVMVASADSGSGRDQVWWGGETAHGYESQFVTVSSGESVSSSDSGTGTDTQSLTAEIPSLDAGSGTDSQALTALESSADAGSGADAQRGIGLSSADYGAGTDGQQVTAAISASDAGTGSDAQGSIPVSSADAGTGTEAQTVSASVTSSDSGSGTDQQGNIPVASQDAGAGTEAQTVSASVVSADAGSGGDTQGSIVLAGSDFGTGSDTGTVTASLASSDAGTGLDAQGSIPLSSTDAGSGTESQGTAASVAGSDTGTGLDTGIVSGSGSTPFSSDSGQGTELQRLTAEVPALDSATGTESQGVALSSADSGTGADTQGVAIVVPVSGSDTGTGSDAQGSIPLSSADAGSGSEVQHLSASTTDTDTGHGTENQQIIARVADTDAGSGLDVQTAGGASVTASDGGQGAEAQFVSAFLYGSDTGIGTELQAVSGEAFGSSDSGTGTELQQITAYVSDYDSGTGTEAQSYAPGGTFFVSDTDSGRGQEGDTEGYAGADTGTGTDTQGIPLVLVSDADAGTGAGSGTLFIAVQAVQDHDGCTGSEAWSTNVTWTASDSGQGTDAQQLLYAPSGTDAGTGAENAAYFIEVFPYPPPWLYNAPEGGYRLVFRPGTQHERLVQAFRGLQREVYAQARFMLARIGDADSLSDVADCDSGSGAESSGPTATVTQFPLEQAEVQLSVHPEAWVVMYIAGTTYAVSDSDSATATEAVAVG